MVREIGSPLNQEFRVNKQITMLAVAGSLLAIAIYRFVQFSRSQADGDALAYFYDVSERKLFTAARTLVPPTRGLNDAELDAMRAIVVSTSGKANDKAHFKIAYLEKYAPELKAQVEAMQRGASPPAREEHISRTAGQSLTFVRRVEEPTWHPVNSPEAGKIMTEWQKPGPEGKIPVVCSP